MTKNQPLITIRIAYDPETYSRATSYLDTIMFERHGAKQNPENEPSHLFVATAEDEIIGTLGLELGQSSVPLTVEQYFVFDYSKLPIAYTREQTIFYSRWASSKKKLGNVLWYVASQYALEHGYIYSTCMGKPSIIDYYKKAFDCHWLKIEEAALNTEAVGKDERKVFFHEPKTEPYVGIIREQIKSLPPIVESIMQKSDITVVL